MNGTGTLLVDPNTADIEALTQLPGIGPSLAQRILAARPFKTLDDLQRVSGISPSLIEHLRPYVDLPSTPPAAVKETVLEEATPPEKEIETPSEPSEHEAQGETPQVIPSAEPEAAGPQEATVPEMRPPPGTAAQPAAVTRAQAIWLSVVSGVLALFLALGLTLGIIASLNGGRLQFASPAQVNELAVRIDALDASVETIGQDISGLRTRVDNLETLGGRVSAVEQTVEQVRSDVDAAAAQVADLNQQVNQLGTQVKTLQTQSQRFQGFLDGLHQLMNNLFPPLEAGK